MVVEFDHSINAAVKRLRDALRDSAERPRYVETLARRGYRFIGELDAPGRSTPVEPVIRMPRRPAEPLPPRRRPQLRPRILMPVVVAGVILMIGLGTIYYTRRARAPETPQALIRLDVELGVDTTPRSERGTAVILSPDGARLVFQSQSKLFSRSLDQAAAAELPGTEGAQAAFFSPDGQWVAFFAGNRLKKLSLQTGKVIEVCAAALGDGGAWGEDGNIIAASNVARRSYSAPIPR
jgi:serine/threonine-protein kinase